jgi:protein-S-isoprenylcysteine O-methyltransferase Ste14
MMPSFSVLAYAVLCCVVFILSALYFSVFLLTNGRAITSFDSGWAAAVDVALVAAFGAVHSVIARAWFKRVWTRVVPRSAERATYVLQSSLLLALIAWQWQPIDGVIWSLDGPAARVVIVVFLAGAGLTVASMFQLGHMEFLGIRQAWDNFNARPDRPTVFRKPLLYRIVRHPLQLGLMVMFSATRT